MCTANLFLAKYYLNKGDLEEAEQFALKCCEHNKVGSNFNKKEHQKHHTCEMWLESVSTKYLQPLMGSKAMLDYQALLSKLP